MSNDQLSDFNGRQGVAAAVGLAGIGSGAFNVWGAYQISSDPVAAVIFAGIVTACEVIAFLSLRHIVRDWENRQYIKARIGAAILVIAIAGCFFSGKRAFHMISVEAEVTYQQLVADHKVLADLAVKAEADYKISQDPTTTREWKQKVARATTAKIEMEKSKPISEPIMWLFLVLFEAIKIGGLWAIATPTARGLTRGQRRAKARTAKLNEAKADAEFQRKLRDIEDADEAADDAVDGNVTPLRA